MRAHRKKVGSQKPYSLLNGTSGGLAPKRWSKFIFRYSTMAYRDGTLHWGSRPHMAEGPTHFPRCTLETGGPGSPFWSVPFERLPKDCLANQQNQHRHTVGTRYVDPMPSLPGPPPQTRIHQVLLLVSHHVFVCSFVMWCTLLLLFTFWIVSFMHVWGQPNSLLCTCSQVPSLRQARIVRQLMERESWEKTWSVLINQQATRTSRYSKQLGFSWTTA